MKKVKKQSPRSSNDSFTKKIRSRTPKILQKNKARNKRISKRTIPKSNPGVNRRNENLFHEAHSRVNAKKSTITIRRTESNPKSKTKTKSNKSRPVPNNRNNSSRTRSTARRNTHKPRAVTKLSKRSSRTRYNVKAFYARRSPEYFLAHKKYLGIPKIEITNEKGVERAVYEILLLRPKIQRFFARFRTRGEQFYSLGYDIKVFKFHLGKWKKIIDQISYMPVTLKLEGKNLDDQINRLIDDITQKLLNYLARRGQWKIFLSGIDMEVQISKAKIQKKIKKEFRK